MKIGIDARFWNESGVGRYIRNLVWQLQEIDKKNSYVLFTSEKNQPKHTNPNWKIVPTDIHWHSFNEQIKFAQIINRQRLDLMHFPYFSVPMFYNKPFVVTIHDLILHHYPTGEATTRPYLVYRLKLLAYKFIIKKASQDARKIITVSHATKDEIIKHLKVSKEKITVIYEGVEPKTSLSSPLLSTYNFQLSTFNFLLHVGNLYPHKNMDFVLEAIRKIKKQENISVPLVIAGKEDFFYNKFKLKAKKLGLIDQITFLGEIKDSDLYYLYKNALAYISPSLMEGFDLPVTEAMGNNCLVLVSDIPVHREICKNAAIYFNTSDIDDLASKIKAIYDNGKDKYKEKIKIGNSLTDKFDWTQMAKETLKLYSYASHPKF